MFPDCFESLVLTYIFRAIDLVRSVLEGVGQSIYDMTGWSFLCLVGGPRPIEGGKIAVTTSVLYVLLSNI